MKILITTFGTRGDIQPFIALAKGLREAGHEAAICTSAGYRQEIEKYDIQYLFMKNEMLELSQHLLETNGVLDRMKTARKMGPAIRRTMDDEWSAARTFQPDLLIYHPKCLGSYHAAEKLNIPAILAIPLPFYTPTAEFPVPFISKNLGASLNRFSFKAIISLANAGYARSVNDFRRKTLSLPAVGRFADLLKRSNGEAVPVMYPISSHVVPVPEDYPQHVHVTGYWFLDQETNWEPSPNLVNFLKSGPAPIYIGFGSMSAVNTKKRTEQIIQAIKNSGQRAIFASGWGEWEQLTVPETIFPLKSVPHDWLFPQVTAVIHHGGAGTTAAGLKAGKPSLICPFLGDQPFWGRRVYKLGAGPKPIPQRKINAANLAEAIDLMLNDSTIQQRASELGKQIREEDGIAAAEHIISSIA
jgi:sterol 3beta-glucosyltransferase